MTTRTVESYGEHPLQVGEWWVPNDGAGTLPTVVLIHGGYWRKRYDLHLEDAVAGALAERGFLVWNLDYRSSAEPWPTTLSDVAAGYDHLVSSSLAERVDRKRIAVAGHSAGGHLALWLAGRHRLPAGAPGAATPATLTPALAVAQAPVASLVTAAHERLGHRAAVALTGGSPAKVPERYAVADPMALLPTGVPSVCIHSAGDGPVPLSQSEAYVAAALAAGDQSELRLVPGDHFAHLDPASPACAALWLALAPLAPG
ncbi:MAG TPA: alpha/beta hydrolase [Mycobacteriales bacterium]|nr:alpha/beta hydrolase [Mycobacteriales bacterium]